jgi:hypothetical protein
MDVEVERRAEALNDGHAAGLESAAYAVRPGAPPKPAQHDRDEGTQHDAGERGVERHAVGESAERDGYQNAHYRSKARSCFLPRSSRCQPVVRRLGVQRSRSERNGASRKSRTLELSAASVASPHNAEGIPICVNGVRSPAPPPFLVANASFPRTCILVRRNGVPPGTRRLSGAGRRARLERHQRRGSRDRSRARPRALESDLALEQRAA